MPKRNLEWWKEKLNRSSSFFIALFLHVVILAMIATVVIFKPTILTTPDFDKVYMPPGGPPPPQQQRITVKLPTVPVPILPAIINPNNPTPSFTLPILDLNTVIDETAKNQVVKPSIMVATQNGAGLGRRLPNIRQTVLHWRTSDNILNSDSDAHNLVAKFPVYLARYADGDWNWDNDWRNPKGVMASGTLVNMVVQVGRWSHGSLKGQEVKEIAIDSPELLSDPPPYIYFTGHRDFHLTNAEIVNLQKYLQIGGAIWGDSAFAGDGSRFDVAFHREMKRVLPDIDKNFEVLPMDHDIFTKSWFPIDKIPSGMNYRADPVEIINLDGKLAVIYTPNDYTDMMTLVLRPGVDPPEVDNVAQHLSEEDGYAPFTPAMFWGSNTFFFRNYQPGPAQDSYKLAMNILTHLLIRFDNELNMAP